MIFIRGVGRIIMLISMSTALCIGGCKKMEDTPPLSEETTAAVPKLKQAVDLQLVEDGFVSPIGVVPIPDNSGRLVVIDQIGKLWVLDASGNKLTAPFIDLTSRMVTLNPGFDERGLLGVAFHPDYANNGRLFIYYNAPPRAGGPTPTATCIRKPIRSYISGSMT